MAPLDRIIAEALRIVNGASSRPPRPRRVETEYVTVWHGGEGLTSPLFEKRD